MPIEYQLTLQARYLREHPDPEEPDFENAEDRLLLHSGGDNFLIFATNEQLRALHRSEFWVGDGTFEKCPKLFAQLYVLHGFINGEGNRCVIFNDRAKQISTWLLGVPLCQALMPNRTRDTYERLFTVLRTALVDRFGNVGSVHTILFDFEKAPHLAAKETFQNGMICDTHTPSHCFISSKRFNTF